MFNVEQIQEILPHRYPFLMIDRVLEVEPGIRAVTIKNISVNERHFSAQPTMPESLIVETMAQSAIMLFGKPLEQGKAYYFGSIKAEFFSLVYPGDQLKITAEAVKLVSDRGLISVKAEVADRQIAVGRIGYSIGSLSASIPVAQPREKLTIHEKEELAQIFTDKYYEQTYENGVNYAVHLILQLFLNTGILELLKNKPVSADEIIQKLKFSPRARYALGWMLSFLSQNSFLSLQNQNYSYNREVKIDPDLFLEKGLALGSGITPTSNLMSYVISEYPNYLSGTKSGLEILFSGDKISFWGGYFGNDNSGYRVYNALGAFGVLKWAFKNGSVRILELGAGTGGATALLLDKLKEKSMPSGINEYIFSDVSPVFLRIGNRAIMNKATEDFQYALKKLDFESSLVSQGIPKNSIDVVYAVNALHVAKDLVSALKNVYEVLKPGGRIILSEHCRPRQDYLLLQEFIFNLLDNYVQVKLDKDLRPVPGFLDYEHWKRNLQAAGFRNIEAVFNTDAIKSAYAESRADILAMVVKAERLDKS